ncbi:LEA type 2 family protein [Halobacteria archaeon AArc-curdl1]|uniref:LEA type 2 family protein n=1 Tax=Natronosalvus hydrolyticus TaxID=2979988 RepID=A0AAP2Z606_9EURY|nr:LEA type 2 family protein [Halobacteria archaeon AArc-curdl1]
MVRNRIQSLLFGSGVRILLSLLLAVVVLIGGAYATGFIGVPAVESVDNEFGNVTETDTEILTEMTVTNPNPIGAAAADVNATYVVWMNDVEMAEGGGDEIRLEPGTSTESFRTEMRNERIPNWWVTHIENDEETHVLIDATVSSGLLDRSTSISDERTIETDLLSSFNSDETRPIDANRALVDDPFLYVNETRGQWGDVDDRHTELELAFDMYNPQDYAIPMTRLGYEITMNDVVIGQGESDREHVLQPGRETTVDTTTHIENRNLDDWWVTHVENEEVSELRIEFTADFELAAGTTISIPLEEMTYEETVETDIWGNEEDTENGTNDAAGEDGEETQSDGDESTDDGAADDGETSTDDDETNDEDDGAEDSGGDETDEEDDDGGLLSLFFL